MALPTLQTYKTGSALLDAVSRIEFRFEHESAVSTLPSELQSLFGSSGKRFRPALVYLFGEVFGLETKVLEVYARAVEMTHTASLVHDDVIDEASERRGVETLNSKFTNTQAILAGDYLLAQVIGDLLPLNRIDIIQDLTDAIKDLADGEWLQAKLKTQEAVTWNELEVVAKKKTGSLMKWSCLAAAKMANMSDSMVATCAELGNDIGVYFQMLDDVNDFNPHSGKPFGADIVNGQKNFVTCYLLEENPMLASQLQHFKVTRELTCREELEKAKEVVVKRSIDLEMNLNERFNAIAHESAPETVEVFRKMLLKVREAFNKSSLA
jgi:geranylgeranyl pyrophosphate synthase